MIDHQPPHAQTHPPSKRSLRLRHWVIGGAAVLGLLVLMGVSAGGFSLGGDLATAAPLPSMSAPAAVPLPPVLPPPVETVLEVRRKDTLSAVFDRAGITPRFLYELMQNKAAAEPLKRVFPGETLVVYRRDADVVRIDYRPDIQRTWIIEPTEGGFAGRWEVRDFERRITTRQVTIENSLYESAQAMGLSESVILQVAEIFGWDIDFALDIRRGDQMGVVYEELWLDGAYVRDGATLAARFRNDGRLHEAYRFDRPNGAQDYYDAEGRSMRKQFLRTPVDFRRISSRFRGERWHPVLGIKRPHRGVDYAASPGTPVRVTGDGKVILAGNKGGYGKTVIVRHGQGTQTLYAHLKGYAKGLRTGASVRQGQTIGYVGSTGVATGPHLHYEFQVGGVHRNPLTVKLPDAAPLPKTELAGFADQTAGLRTLLDRTLAPQLAQAR